MKKKNKKIRNVIITVFVVAIICVVLILLFNNGLFNSVTKGKEKKPIDDKTVTEEVSLDLFGDYYDEASDYMKNMSNEEKVGQLFFVRYNENVNSQIENYHPGGYILFGGDFRDKDKDSLTNELKSNQELSKTPLAIGVDEEGGTVTRVSRYTAFRSSRFDSPQNIYNQGGYDLLSSTEKEKAELLLSLGININLAPVADVSTNADDFIYERSFGKSADETATYVTNMVDYANEYGISSCLKHFPGYGNNVDTHTGIAIDNRSLDNFRENDFKPFSAGIKANVPTILVSHNIVKSMDETYPSSLSKNVHDILRNELGFTGVIMTDDLAMDAVKEYTDNGSAAVLAVNAGNDLIITSDLENMYNEVLEAVNNGTIKKETLDTAVKRIIAWKYAYGIF